MSLTKKFSLKEIFKGYENWLNFEKHILILKFFSFYFAMTQTLTFDLNI